ncbi:MAG: HAD family hydrolase [Erysipelotrichaceae bacterium]|jgi:Cof subfamily protein (haloacid dehalogenase superfamily)
MNQNIKLVVADIDGTLLSDERKLTDFTKKTINELKEKGILFGVASGRCVDNQLMKFYKKWGFKEQFDIIIGMNGAQLYDGINQKRYDYHSLSKEEIKEICELVKPLDVNPFVYDVGKMICFKDDEGTRISSLRNDMPFMVNPDGSLIFNKDRPKLLIRVDEDKMEALEKYIEENIKENAAYRAVKTQTTMLEFMDYRTNKGDALINFCQLNDIDLKDVMTFGDISNDNELLEVAGVGVCMINGSDETKGFADDITEKSNNEDGFAYYLQEKVLKYR